MSFENFHLYIIFNNLGESLPNTAPGYMETFCQGRHSSVHTAYTKMATPVNLPSEPWRAMIRRKRCNINKMLKRSEVARRWAIAQEPAIDSGDAPPLRRL